MWIVQTYLDEDKNSLQNLWGSYEKGSQAFLYSISCQHLGYQEDTSNVQIMIWSTQTD